MHIGYCVDIHLQFNLGFDISGAFSLPGVLNTNIYPGLALHSSQLIHLNSLVLFEEVRSFCFASSLFIPQSQRQFCEESKNRHITRVNLWHLQSQQISVCCGSVDSEFNYVKTKKINNSKLILSFFPLSLAMSFFIPSWFSYFHNFNIKEICFMNAIQLFYHCGSDVSLWGINLSPMETASYNVIGLNCNICDFSEKKQHIFHPSIHPSKEFVRPLRSLDKLSIRFKSSF